MNLANLVKNPLGPFVQLDSLPFDIVLRHLWATSGSSVLSLSILSANVDANSVGGKDQNSFILHLLASCQYLWGEVIAAVAAPGSSFYFVIIIFTLLQYLSGSE